MGQWYNISIDFVFQGDVIPKKIPPPSKEWLANEWLLPPRGKGRGSPSIASELGVSKRTILRWVKTYDITESTSRRQSVHRIGKKTWSKESPYKDQLALLYLLPPEGGGLSLAELAKHYQVSVPTIRKWLDGNELTQPFNIRHSLRMGGDGNPAYTNGGSLHYHKNILRRAEIPEVCKWCNITDDIQVHHKDHDRTNGEIDNLMWLCGTCNRLESNLWALEKDGKAEVMFSEKIFLIKFKQK